jgi:hypothetical protein
MVGERIVVVLVVAAREVLVDEDLQAVVVPVLDPRVAVTVVEHVVDDFDEQVDPFRGPDHLEAPSEVVIRVLGA